MILIIEARENSLQSKYPGNGDYPQHQSFRQMPKNDFWQSPLSAAGIDLVRREQMRKYQDFIIEGGQQISIDFF